MICTTIQHKNILRTLTDDKIYFADYTHVPENNKTAYKELARIYRYKGCPIFAGGVSKRCNFHNINVKLKNAVMIELDVPKQFFVQQNYDKWIEFLQYFEKTDDINTTKVSNMFQDLSKTKPYATTQIVLPYIDLNWISLISNPVPDAFIEMHINTDKSNILQISEYYETTLPKKN